MGSRRLGLCAILLSLSLISGCALSPQNRARNLPAHPKVAGEPVLIPRPLGENVLALSFSGGGMRAAAFSLGALQGLDALRVTKESSLLDDLSFITSVSGGSITAAYYGIHGKSALVTMRPHVLLKDGETHMRLSLLNPTNVFRLLAGGLNDRNQLQAWLDRDIFHGARFNEMLDSSKPDIWINATNVYDRISFPFHQRAFDALCSDLASFPVSEAVAASMAVPLVFAPVILRKYPESCQTQLPNVDRIDDADRPLLTQALARAIKQFRDPTAGQFLKLVDGGITDNYGLASIQQSRLLLGTPYGPLTSEDAINIKRMLFIVVDAGLAQRGDWNRSEQGPSGIELASAAIDSAINTNVRMSYDNFVPMMKQWQKDIITYRCQLPTDQIAKIVKTRPSWRCDDVEFSVTRIAFNDLDPERAARLNRIPTSLRLTSEQVDELIAASHEAIIQNDKIERYFQVTRKH
ncbi:patatin-like phospholipase family protein [Massilia sp. KIM]|uniref:patatin-like phospholipase family protein n=1 Tax=Massilia sp. KIM TaxID=1955422 RepID=UPI00098EADEB